MIRCAKIALVWSAAFFVSLVALSNITDYGTNYAFVSHVLSMDTIFADSQLGGRAIVSPLLHHLAYWLIIAGQIMVGILCWWGGWRMWRRRCERAQNFATAKQMAVAGLTLGVLLWFVGFITVGGEWFLMWQSQTWNAQRTAFSLSIIFMLLLIYVSLPDGEDRGGE